MATFNIEKTYNDSVIGVDEAGRGPWAGPVVVAGVSFKSYDNLPDWVFRLNDSKKISALKRRELFSYIQGSNTLLSYYIAVVDVDTIDRINILEATMEGMRKCINVLRQNQEVVLVDGNRRPVQEKWCDSVTKGDSLSLSIAAASILAKVYRDQIMANLAIEYPQYGWDQNAGYGTVHHQTALKKYGISPYHRKSFAPIRALSI